MAERVMLTAKAVRRMLPKVGDRLERVPVVHGTAKIEQRLAPRPCTVVEVNREHLWYRVRFDTGYCACYKLPGGDA